MRIIDAANDRTLLAKRETHRLLAQMRRHWWYRGRTACVASILRRAGVRAGGSVLDFGCGTGLMGPVLSRYGALTGVEGSPDAIEFGDFSAYDEVCLATSLEDGEFPRRRYDLIALLDVLEHVPDDRGLLAGLRDLLAPEGTIVVSVPMDPSLFGAVDEIAGHVRRYTRASLERLAGDAGLKIVAATGYVVSLLPLARWQRRRVAAGLAAPSDEMSVPPNQVNVPLSWVAVAEGRFARCVELPQGLSLVCIMRPLRTKKDHARHA